MPPLFVVGPAGGGELANYRVQGRYVVVDRLFGAAELRIGNMPLWLYGTVALSTQSATSWRNWE